MVSRGSAPAPHPAPIGRGAARGKASWPGFYRRGTMGATARGSGTAPCCLYSIDRHSATGLMARALNPLAAGLPKSANHQNSIPPQGVNLPTANSGKQKPHKGYACLPPAVGKQKPSLLDASKASICKKLPHPARGKSAPRRLRGSRAAIGSGGKKPCPF